MSVLTASPIAYDGPLEMAQVKWSGIQGNTFVSFTLHSELPRPTVSLHAEPFTPCADNSSTVEFEIQFHVADYYFLLHFLPAAQVTHSGVAGTGLTDEILWF